MPPSRRKRAASPIFGGDTGDASSDIATSRTKKARTTTQGSVRDRKATAQAATVTLHLHALSQEVLLRVLRHLPLSDLLNVGLVSHAWHRISLDSSVS